MLLERVCWEKWNGIWAGGCRLVVIGKAGRGELGTHRDDFASSDFEHRTATSVVLFLPYCMMPTWVEQGMAYKADEMCFKTIV